MIFIPFDYPGNNSSLCTHLNLVRVFFDIKKGALRHKITLASDRFEKCVVIDCRDFLDDATGDKLLLSFSRTLRADRSLHRDFILLSLRWLPDCAFDFITRFFP